MHARLGFAIAAHADPQVLLVDEVLSVGDRVFRAKCLEKMRNFLKRGVAVVFVSHDLGAVARFCDRAMVLAKGEEVFCGPSGEAVAQYYRACSDSLLVRGPRQSPAARLLDARLCDTFDHSVTTVSPGDMVRFKYELAVEEDILRPSYGFSLLRIEDHLILYETSSTRLGISSPPALQGTRQRVAYQFPMSLPPGEYALGLHVREHDGLRYAVEDPQVVRILVVGPKRSGGVVHLDPQLRVEETSPRATPAAAISAGT
jgi:ABC-type glutathione transport system ATPase component